MDIKLNNISQANLKESLDRLEQLMEGMIDVDKIFELLTPPYNSVDTSKLLQEFLDGLRDPGLNM